MLSGSDLPLEERKNASFISFVSIDLKIYDIYFERVDVSYILRLGMIIFEDKILYLQVVLCWWKFLEQSKFNYERKYELIRHRLHSFVGPDNKIYNVVYNDGNEPTIIVTGEKKNWNLISENWEIIENITQKNRRKLFK